MEQAVEGTLALISLCGQVVATDHLSKVQFHIHRRLFFKKKKKFK
jgi:hypothetical protein